MIGKTAYTWGGMHYFSEGGGGRFLVGGGGLLFLYGQALFLGGDEFFIELL